jgi:ubiquinone/menaquinone biosynthesis C-methylase UbiE
MPLDAIQQAAQDQFGRQSRNYGGTHILADISDVTAALREIALPPRARVLDLACGAGHAGLHLASLGHEVTLSDLAAPMLARARESAAARGLEVSTREHPAETIPDPAESYDLVTCRVAAHHFSSPALFINETARVLRPDGWLLLIDGSVPDEQPEAEAWLHALEKLRDPSHARFLTPRAWMQLCAAASLAVRRADLHSLKQPDLEWYFEAAATPAANRARVRELIATASPAIRGAFRLGEEEGKTIWWWPRLTLLAQKCL